MSNSKKAAGLKNHSEAFGGAEGGGVSQFQLPDHQIHHITPKKMQNQRNNNSKINNGKKDGSVVIDSKNLLEMHQTVSPKVDKNELSGSRSVKKFGEGPHDDDDAES